MEQGEGSSTVWAEGAELTLPRMGQTMPVSGMNPWVPTQYPFGLNVPDLTPYYWKTEMKELKKMGLTPGSLVAPLLITEEEAEALKKKF